MFEAGTVKPASGIMVALLKFGKRVAAAAVGGPVAVVGAAFVDEATLLVAAVAEGASAAACPSAAGRD